MANLTHDQEIAKTILQQLGGRRFSLMTGARNFVAVKSGLAFRLPSRFAKSGINSVKITLSPTDTYDIQYVKIGPAPKFSRTIISTHHSVYAEDLQRLFTHATGLDTSLGERRSNPSRKRRSKLHTGPRGGEILHQTR